jgi:hypothetical protein
MGTISRFIGVHLNNFHKHFSNITCMTYWSLTRFTSVQMWPTCKYRVVSLFAAVLIIHEFYEVSKLSTLVIYSMVTWFVDRGCNLQST